MFLTKKTADNKYNIISTKFISDSEYSQINALN